MVIGAAEVTGRTLGGAAQGQLMPSYSRYRQDTPCSGVGDAGALGDGGGRVEVAAAQATHPGVDGQNLLIALLQPRVVRLRDDMHGYTLKLWCGRLQVRVAGEKADGE